MPAARRVGEYGAVSSRTLTVAHAGTIGMGM